MNAKYNGLGVILGACLLVPGMALAVGQSKVDGGIWSEKTPVGIEGNNAKEAFERRKRDLDRKLRPIDDSDERAYVVQEEEANH